MAQMDNQHMEDRIVDHESRISRMEAKVEDLVREVALLRQQMEASFREVNSSARWVIGLQISILLAVLAVLAQIARTA